MNKINTLLSWVHNWLGEKQWLITTRM